MKRFIFFILSVCLCLTFTLSGCSCTGDAILEFNSTQVKNIKSETLCYSVTLEKNYKDIKRTSSLNENLVPEYNNGEYVAKYEMGTKVSPPVNKINLSTSKSVINKITTTLSIDVVDTKRTADDSDDKVYKDQIISEVYFYDSAWSYAPIYSKTTVKNTYIANDETKIVFAHKIYQYETVYKKNSYTVTKKYYAEDENEDITGQMDLNTLDQEKLKLITGNAGGGTYEYNFREVLDNVQLIFATRNLDIDKGNSTTIPIVSYTYSKSSQLEIRNLSNSTLNIDTLNYTNPTFTNLYAQNTLSIPVKNISISLSNTDYMGLSKYVVVQKDSADKGKIKNNGLILEYAEAITASSSYNCFGALVYRLKDVNLTYSI